MPYFSILMGTKEKEFTNQHAIAVPMQVSAVLIGYGTTELGSKGISTVRTEDYPGLIVGKITGILIIIKVRGRTGNQTENFLIFCKHPY